MKGGRSRWREEGEVKEGRRRWKKGKKWGRSERNEDRRKNDPLPITCKYCPTERSDQNLQPGACL